MSQEKIINKAKDAYNMIDRFENEKVEDRAFDQDKYMNTLNERKEEGMKQLYKEETLKKELYSKARKSMEKGYAENKSDIHIENKDMTVEQLMSWGKTLKA